jgi:AraC family transcriptional regulator
MSTAFTSPVGTNSLTPETRLIANRLVGRHQEWMHHVIALLDAAIGQLRHEQPAHGTILEALSLLRRQEDPQSSQEHADGGQQRLLAWQARKVVEHINRHVASRLLVADLCALLQLSEGHFSRSFRGTFGSPPYAFVVRRRVELAARYLLQTDMSLSEIALQCGFADQSHLCRQFRQVMGETPAAWRRAQRGRQTLKA